MRKSRLKVLREVGDVDSIEFMHEPQSLGGGV
jgi:hypothetical protein